MRKILLILLLPTLLSAQTSLPYEPQMDARDAFAQALASAKKSGKHLWIQLGQPDCPVCQRLYWFIAAHPQLSDPLHQHFIPLHIATSRQNIPLLRAWNSPQLEHGVPVILVIDAEGKTLNIAPSKNFTAQVGEFSETQLADYIRCWSPAASTATAPDK
jgi:hypothetical protein